MIGHVILGTVSGVAALGGILASVLGARKERVWVVWLRGDGALVGKPCDDIEACKALQTELALKRGRTSVLVTRKPDGTFACSNTVRPTPEEKLKAIRMQIRMREEKGMAIPPGLLKREAALVRKVAVRPR